MLDYGTHQILHKHRQRDLIAQSQNDALAQLAQTGRRQRVRMAIGAIVLTVLRHAARRAPTSERLQNQPEPYLQGVSE